MKERILQLMQEEALTNAEFAKKIGISASTLSHITTGRNETSLRVALLIHKAYPSINLDWLLYGEGEMRKADTPETTVLPRQRFLHSLEAMRIQKLRTGLRFVSIFARKMPLLYLIIHQKMLSEKRLSISKSLNRKSLKYVFSLITAPFRCSALKNHDGKPFRLFAKL